MADRFGFTVDEWPKGSGRWSVYLPHSCDEWEIASRLGRAEAAAELRRFIAEAQEVLANLVES